MRSSHSARLLPFILCPVVFAFAQSNPGAVELSVFAGANANLPALSPFITNMGPSLAPGLSLNVHEGPKTRWHGGAGFGVALARHALLVFEGDYNRASVVDATLIRGATPISAMRGSTYIYDFSGALQAEIPVRTRRAVPYLMGGAGAAVVHERFSTGYQNQAEFASGVNPYFAYHFGGGLRLYAGRQWGVRPEVKVVRHRIDPGLAENYYYRVSLGLFYRTAGRLDIGAGSAKPAVVSQVNDSQPPPAPTDNQPALRRHCGGKCKAIVIFGLAFAAGGGYLIAGAETSDWGDPCFRSSASCKGMGAGMIAGGAFAVVWGIAKERAPR